MGRLPIDRSVLDSALERMDIADIAQATIRQSGDIARIMETQTGMEFLHLEICLLYTSPSPRDRG
mgnify:CR=1 FL=1